MRIKGHMDLCLWLRGDVQRFLPHEVFIAVWGDFATDNVSFDVISPLSPLRMETLYVLGNSNLSAIESCRNCTKVASERDSADESSTSIPRESEIMHWVRVGKTNYEIGVILNISAFTVKNHRQRIFKKLGTSSRAQTVNKLRHSTDGN